MSTVVCSLLSTVVESGAGKHGAVSVADAPSAGIFSGWEIRWEPTPLPTAGVRMRSSSSLGSNSGCVLLDRDALAMLCFCREPLLAQEVQNPRGRSVVILQGLGLGIDVSHHLVQPRRLAYHLVGADGV